VIQKTDAIVIRDFKETLMLEYESHSKMLQKQKDPMMSEKKLITKQLDYAALNQLSKDFETHFIPQTELSAEQAFWSQYLVNSKEPNLSSSTTIVEVPKELPKVSMAFIQHCVEKNRFQDKMKDVLKENERLLEQAISVDIVNIVVHANVNSACKTVNECERCVTIGTKLQRDFIKRECYDKLFKQYTTFEKHCISLESQEKDMVIIKLKERIKSLSGNVKEEKIKGELEEIETINIELDTVIMKLKERIKSLSGNVKEEKIKRELEEIETINIELDHGVTKLVAENEHLKQTYKQLYDLIKSSRVQSKEQCDDLIKQVNIKSVENSDLNAKLLKIDVTPLAPKLRNNRTAHTDYLRHTQEETNTPREIVKRVNLLSSASGSQPQGNTKKDGVDLLTGSRGNNLYTLSLQDMMASSPICLLSKASKTKSWLWHCRLSNLNFGAINHLARQGLVRGLPKLKFEKGHLCSACAMGKSTKKSHKPKSEDINQEKLYLLHMDVCGPMRVESVNGKKYILVIIDDYSRFTWVKFLRSKEEAPDFIIKFLKMIQVRLKVPVCQAVATACYTQNRSIIRLRYGKTPYELMHNKLPDLSFLHVFGALCYPTNDSENLGKLQLKADIGIFIGYTPTKKAFRIYNRRTRRIVKTIHVDFDELTVMASEQSSSGNEMTPATYSSGLVQKPSSSTPYVPPSRNDWDLLFQPMFDELLIPAPSVDHQAPEVIASIVDVIPPVQDDSTGLPSSTSVDQDAHSPSKYQTTPETQSFVIPQDVEEDNIDIGRYRIEFLINKLGMRSFTPETLKQLMDEVDETMDTTIDQQVAMDEALVPHAKRQRIGRSNFYLLSDIKSKESTLQLVYDVLRLSPFFKAFLVTADVLEIYMHELWATATFGALLRIELTNEDIRNSNAYQEYYAIATGVTPPKPMASVWKTRSSSDTTITPPTAAAGSRPTTFVKGKQAAKASKAKSLSALSKVVKPA
nr:retrovirus-related Pol polyprotein from transposon TNT 1-94 [Tanacetum cinerariifolium]